MFCGLGALLRGNYRAVRDTFSYSAAVSCVSVFRARQENYIAVLFAVAFTVCHFIFGMVNFIV